jgi:hypothetical protein
MIKLRLICFSEILYAHPVDLNAQKQYINNTLIVHFITDYPGLIADTTVQRSYRKKLMNETYTTDTRLSALKKSIPVWITSLQGTGNMELNQVVNQLHYLNQKVSHPSEGGIQQEVTNLYRQVQVIKTRHQEPYRTRLNEVEAALAKLRV